MLIKDFKIISFLFGTVILIFLPLWSNTGIFWDGWIYHLMIERANFADGILKPFSENGRPYSAYIIYAFRFFENPSFASLVLSILCVALAAVFFYQILIELEILDKKFAFCAALLGAIHPAFEISLSLSSINFQIALPFFYLGCLLLIQARSKGGNKKIIFNCLGLTSWFVSFSGEATVFLALWMIVLITGFRKLSLKEISIDYLHACFRYWWLLLFIIASAVISFFYFHPYGAYSGVRYGGLSFDNVARVLRIFAEDSIKIDIIGVTVLLVCWLGALFFSKSPFKLRYTVNHNLINAFLIGLAGYFVSQIPYIIGSRWPDVQGWSLRFFLFSTFPIGLMIVSSCCLTAKLVHQKFQKIVSAVFICLFIGSHGFIIISHSIDWHTRWIRDSLVYDYIKKNINEDVGLILFDEKATPIFSEHYRDYELIALVQRSLGRSDIIADNLKTAGINSFNPDVWLANKKGSTTYGPFFSSNKIAKKCQIIELNSNTVFHASTIKKLSNIYEYYFLDDKKLNPVKTLKIGSKIC